MFNLHVVVLAAVAFAGGVSSSTPNLPEQCRDPVRTSITREVSTFLKETYDYIIVGGGTAGMALAAKIAEHSQIKVGVLEAGDFFLDDPLINTPALSNQVLGNSTYDWDFLTLPQLSAGSRVFELPRGKMLGGCSGINLMAFNRASSQEYDALLQFAPGSRWDWEGLSEGFSKSAHLAPLSDNPFIEIPINTTSRDTTAAAGPVKASYNNIYFGTVSKMVETFNAMGVPTNLNNMNGHATGIYNSLVSVDRSLGSRSYATNYLCDIPAKSNLRILLGAQALKINFSPSSSILRANSIQFSAQSKTYNVSASNEIILSAGTFQTPHLLELSGIGNSSILSMHGIRTLIDLPSVGENSQEHLYVGVQYKLKNGITTFDILRNNASFAAQQQQLYDKTGTGYLAALDATVAFVPFSALRNSTRVAALSSLLEKERVAAHSSTLQSLAIPIQQAWIKEGKVGQMEYILWSRGEVNPEPNTSYAFLLGGNSHPTSRGRVHIQSSDPLTPPTIDPGYITSDFDAQVLLDALKYLMAMGKTAPFVDIVDSQTSPDPTFQDDADLLNYVRATAAGGHHHLGTAAMGPRSRGGVVDGNLLVYGTQNLRVVDASIIPFHIASHMESNIYAIAETAAKMILDDSKKYS